MLISIQTLYMVLCRSTFAAITVSNQVSKFLHALYTWIWTISHICPGRYSQTQLDWMGSICERPLSGLLTDVLLCSIMEFGSATQGYSEKAPVSHEVRTQNLFAVKGHHKPLQPFVCLSSQLNLTKVNQSSSRGISKIIKVSSQVAQQNKAFQRL